MRAPDAIASGSLANAEEDESSEMNAVKYMKRIIGSTPQNDRTIQPLRSADAADCNVQQVKSCRPTIELEFVAGWVIIRSRSRPSRGAALRASFLVAVAVILQHAWGVATLATERVDFA